MSLAKGQATNLALKWKLDVCKGGSGVAVRGEAGAPPGYSTSATALHGAVESASRDSQQQHLLTKRAWEVALGPLKQLPMNLFIMYMAGNTISIFPIMMVFMMAWRPMKALLAVGQAFAPLADAAQGGSLLPHKAVFALGNLLAVALAVYKCSTMGLLPTHPSDWLDFVDAAARQEFGFGAFAVS